MPRREWRQPIQSSDFSRTRTSFPCIRFALADGKDLQWLPLLDRKQQLEKLIKKSRCVGNGVGLFEEICARDLEGIIAKRKRGVYTDDGKDWLKIKNPKYSRAEGRHEVLQHKRK